MENKIIVAVKGLIINSGKVLIIKRASNDEIGAGTWECAGGKIEFGEGLETALIREIREEVGLNVEVEKILYATTFMASQTRHVVVLTYLCRSKETDVLLSIEHSEYLWAAKDELRKLLQPGILEDFEKYNVFSIEEIL